EGGIWIAVENGGLMHLTRGRLDPQPRLEGLSSLSILTVHVDRRGVLWAGSAAGLNRWEGNRFVPYLKVDGLPDESITAIAEEPGGALLAGTAAGIARYSGGVFQPFLATNAPTGKISAMVVDPAGKIWIGGDAGLQVTGNELAPGRTVRVTREPVVSLLCRANGEIWFGTASGSLKFIRPGFTNAVEAGHFASPLNSLLEDHEGSIWAGGRQGLSRLKKRQMRFVSPGGEAAPAAIRPGREIISHYSNGEGAAAEVFREGSANFSIQGNDGSARRLPAIGLVKTADGFGGTLWAGTSGEGLWQWDGGRVHVWGQEEGLSDIFVEALHVTGPDSAWVGTRNGGLNHVTRAGIKRFLTPWGFTGNYASVIASDARGTIWIGTTGDGLFSLRDGKFTAHTTRSGLRDNQITALVAEANGTVWAGTARGLNFWDGEKWHAFTEKNGMPESAIDQLQEDPAGNLWLGCGQVIYRCAKPRLAAIAAGESVMAYPIPYGRSDGLAGATVLPGAHLSRNSRKDAVIFSTSRGLLMIEPAKLQPNTIPPPVLIQEVLIGAEAVPAMPVVEAPPGRESIQFRYAALSFAAPEKVRFRCKLAGFDDDWIDAGGSRTMRYAKVPPGTYDFQVTACNNDGIWNEEGAVIALIVAPFWWETIWFRVGAALVACSVFSGIILVQRQKRLEIERLRVRIAGDLHDEIGSSLWSITLLSKMLQQGGTLGEEEKRDAGEIHRIASQTSNALRDIVWLINPGLDTLQDMVLRMRDFLSATVRGMEVHVTADQADLSKKLSLETRQCFFLIFKEAVTNAAKHGQADRLEIHLAESQGVLEMRGKDNGVGFDATCASRGHGIPSLKRRAQTVGGEIRIVSASGQGTEVTMRASLGAI
ncbi:MAG: sensor histidine kinase, partial [Verrucomicrobiota bacterium]